MCPPFLLPLPVIFTSMDIAYDHIVLELSVIPCDITLLHLIDLNIYNLDK